MDCQVNPVLVKGSVCGYCVERGLDRTFWRVTVVIVSVIVVSMAVVIWLT